MADRESENGRRYGGASAGERRAERRGRLIAAAIELLGAPPEDSRGGLTVRAACSAAGLTQRYFYESFESTDELAAAAFDTVIAGAAEAVSEAIADAPAEAGPRSRAVVEAFVAYAIDDPRRARILFVEGAAAEQLREQRAAALRLFADLAAAQGREIYAPGPGAERLVESASFLIAGGMAELLLAWTKGELTSTRDELVEDAAGLLGSFGEAAARLAARGSSRQ